MGVGFPACIKLDEFGAHIEAVFGWNPMHVGSSLKLKSGWRDVDVRLILPDDEYEAWGFGDFNYPIHNEKWVALCLAFSELGKAMTGLPIDFQIQQMTRANILHPDRKEHPRSALGMVTWRLDHSSKPGPPATPEEGAVEAAHGKDATDVP
jgi:hypothetical protein